MKLRSAVFALLLAGTAPAWSQSAPFDMSGERPATPPPASTDTLADAPVASPQAEPTRRYLIPFSELVLPGEEARRSWSFFLTAEEAALQPRLNLGYQNAVIVAPEVSRLNVSINGKMLIDTPAASSDGSTALAVDVPTGLLHAGFNDIVISATQRHRTDCTIPSTFELWTQIDLAKTFLAFDAAPLLTSVEDMRAVGVDETGATRFNLIVPSIDQAVSTRPAMRLAQAIGLTAKMPNQAFTVTKEGQGPAKPGSLNIVLGPASSLPSDLTLPDGAAAGPAVGFVEDARYGQSTLVVTGPDWQAVDTAIEGIARKVDRPSSTQRATLGTRAWRTPDVPLLLGASRITFADLGVATQEFAGRRIRSDFSVGVPSDFYADSYGQATILLDAAYTADVQPGSHIDVYVNDNIAATLPITTADGEILRHMPIKVTMRHFRPGDNNVAIEAVLMTRQDAVCAPGATALDTGRFALFDTSEFVMPDYARIGRTPNLSAISGTGFPFNRTEYPIPLIVDRAQPEALSAAATMLARMSVAAGRMIAVDPDASMASAAGRDALFIGPIAQIAPEVLAQVGVSNEGSANWGDTVASIDSNTEATFDEWRDRLSGSGWRGQVSVFQDWMQRTFNVSMNSFSLFAARPPDFAPSGNTSVLLAEQASPDGGGTWLMVTAPTVNSLMDGIGAMTSQVNWRQMGGRITTFDGVNNKVSAISSSSFTFIETQPFSIANARLIIANWLSANAFYYSIALTLLSIMLGLATKIFLSSLGRRK